MPVSQEEKIVVIARLQACLTELSKQEDLSGLCNEINRMLTNSLNDAVGKLEQISIQDLLLELKTFAPEESVSLFNDLFVEQRLKAIKILRSQAVNTYSSLDISNYYPGYDRIPLKLYNWRDTAVQFQKIVDKFNSGQMSFEQLTAETGVFFDINSKGSKPVLFPDLNDGIIKVLINQKYISPPDVSGMVDDINFIRHKIRKLSKENLRALFAGEVSLQDFQSMGHDAYLFFKKYWLSNHLQETIDIRKYLIYWKGPGKYEFLRKFAAIFPNKETFELCLACTGIHPDKSRSKWALETEIIMQEELDGLRELSELFNKNRFIYSFAYIACFEGNSGRQLSNQWKMIFEELHRENKELEPEPLLQPGANEAAAHDNTAIQKDNVEPAPSDTAKQESFDSDIDLDLDFEELSASDDNVLSTDDKIVLKHSAWSKYLKPFLAENLLGVLGAALLMLAWLCISIWVWDKGDYYKLLTGALPMFCTTLMMAYISKYFHKNLDRGVSPRAPVLFTFLCVLSIPFNYLIALSIFDLQTALGLIVGTILGVIYTASLMLFIGKWIKDSMGFNSGVYLSVINGFLLLPAVSYFSGSNVLPLAINIVLFATFFITIHHLRNALKYNKSKHKFRCLLFGVNYLLALFISCIYVKVMPDFMSIAILLQLIALAVVLLGDQEKIMDHIIAAVSLSVLGILISLKSSYPLTPVCILLSAWLWKINRKYIQTQWLDEVLAGHIFLFSAGVIHGLNQIFTPSASVVISWSILGITISLIITIIYERKIKKITIHSISYLIPLTLLALPFLNYLGMLQNLTGSAVSLCMVFLIGSYGYYRYVIHYNQTLWFINLLIMSCMPCCLLLILHRFDSALLSFSFSALAWTLVSYRFKDALSHTYKTAISAFLSTLAIAGFVLNCLMFHFNPYSLGLIQILSFICMFASILILSKNTMSQVPVYLLFLTSIILGFIIHKVIGINMKSGAGAATAAMAFLYLSHLFRAHKIWHKQVPDTIFNICLPLSSNKFLTFPFEVAGWISAALSFVVICMNYTLFHSDNSYFSFLSIKIFIALLITAYIFYLFVKKYNIRNSGFLIFFPGALILLTVSSLVPIALRPLWLILFLFTYNYFTISFSFKDEFEHSMGSPIIKVNTFLNYSSVLMSFAFYFYYIEFIPESIWNRYLLFLSIPGILIYIHIVFINKGRLNFAHLVPLHTLFLICNIYTLLKHPGFMQYSHLSNYLFSPRVWDVLMVFILGSVALFLPEIIFENSKNKVLKTYSNVFGVWLFGTSCLFCILVIGIFWAGVNNGYYHISPIKFLPFFTISGYFISHAGDRLYKTPILYGAKAFLCCYSAILLCPFSLLSSIIIGFIVFAAMEALIYYCYKNKMPYLMERPSKGGRGNINYPARFANISYIFFYAALCLHILSVVPSILNCNKTPHYMLYFIIPFLVFCFRIFDRAYFGYLALGLFAYINAFMAMNFFDIFIQNNLNIGHLLCVSILFTILVFLLYNIGKRRFTKEVAI